MDPLLVVAVASFFLISVIFSMFGQGGGSLYTPMLVLLGYATLISVSTSLVLNLITALFATVVYFRNRLVDLRLSAAFIPGIVAGAFLGGALGNFVDARLLLWLFVVFLVGAGGRMVYTHWEQGRQEAVRRSHLSPLTYAGVALFSFAVGVLSGLLGIGGGILILPFLVFVYKIPAKLSAGTSMFIVVFSSLFGVAGHSAFGHLDLTLVAATAIAVALGGTLGARYMAKTRAEWIKVGFGLIMWAFALQLVAKLV